MDLTDDLDSLEHLLYEWFAWWANNDDAPVKMPGALHLRTAVTLKTLAMEGKIPRRYDPNEV